MIDHEHCSNVRVFKIEDQRLYLYLNLTTDATFIADVNGNDIGLKFDSSTNIFYKDKNIGRIRLPINGKNLIFIYRKEDGSEEQIDTGVDQKLVECYLDAEVFITKYLVEHKAISLVV